MKIFAIKDILISLRELINEQANTDSINSNFYFYILNSYILLQELNLTPKIISGAGRVWLELNSKLGYTYVVDLNFIEPIMKKEETYLCDIAYQEISLGDFLENWESSNQFTETKRWSKQVLPHKSYDKPPNMSQKPKNWPSQKAPILRPHKRI